MIMSPELTVAGWFDGRMMRMRANVDSTVGRPVRVRASTGASFGHSMRRQAGALTACVLLLAGLVAGSAAQVPPDIAPQYKSRFLAVGNLALVGWAKTTTAGFVYQHSLTPSRIEVMPAGNRVETSPRWYLHLLATSGTRLRSDGVELAGFGQLGLARRNDHPTFTTIALVGQGIYNPRAYGPAARVEIMDNIGLQTGWVFYRGGGSTLFISADYLRDILSDLGLK